jgi:hypothetical protein
MPLLLEFQVGRMVKSQNGKSQIENRNRTNQTGSDGSIKCGVQNSECRVTMIGNFKILGLRSRGEGPGATEGK